MSNKYYTPTIEEFHVGFEFEWYDEDDKDWNRTFIKTQSELVNWTSFDDINKRVKYLDKEDIESLGYKLVQEYPQPHPDVSPDERNYKFCIVDTEDYMNRKLYLYLHCGYLRDPETDKEIRRLSEVSITWRKENMKTEEDVNNIYDLFNGEIKNISELKVLLIQLGIC